MSQLEIDFINKARLEAVRAYFDLSPDIAPGPISTADFQVSRVHQDWNGCGALLTTQFDDNLLFDVFSDAFLKNFNVYVYQRIDNKEKTDGINQVQGE